ncbi:MAG: DUF937 domain-containing protein [Nocardioides sp.]|nr:DUF937 domain-containing protein [Nocardioides sp.]
MSAVDEILQTLPIDQLANQLGEDPDDVEQAALAALPALLGGLHANAQDPAGEASLAEALGQHGDDPAATGVVDVEQIDQADGSRIASHIFGAQEDEVVQQLGGVGSASSGLVKKLIPILAPLVLAYLAKQVRGKGDAATGGGVLGSILSQVLSGAAQGSAPRGSQGAGSIIGDILGGLLGGGRR